MYLELAGDVLRSRRRAGHPLARLPLLRCDWLDLKSPFFSKGGGKIRIRQASEETLFGAGRS